MNRYFCCSCGESNNTVYKCCRHCGEPRPKRVKELKSLPSPDLPKSFLKRRETHRSCSCCNEVKTVDLFPEVGLQCKECITKKAKEWRKNNPHSTSGKRSKRVRQATPKWLTRAQKAEIRKIYTEAWYRSLREGIQYHVDHICPIKNDLVCGLHVPWNLQVITATENLTKNNKFLV